MKNFALGHDDSIRLIEEYWNSGYCQPVRLSVLRDDPELTKDKKMEVTKRFQNGQCMAQISHDMNVSLRNVFCALNPDAPILFYEPIQKNPRHQFNCHQEFHSSDGSVTYSFRLKKSGVETKWVAFNVRFNDERNCSILKNGIRDFIRQGGIDEVIEFIMQQRMLKIPVLANELGKVVGVEINDGYYTKSTGNFMQNRLHYCRFNIPVAGQKSLNFAFKSKDERDEFDKKTKEYIERNGFTQFVIDMNELKKKHFVLN